MDEAVLQRALQAIDGAHDGDPVGDERAYADRVEHWFARLRPEPDATQRLAARCQHLERWAIPRQAFPDGRAGYLRWRRAVQERQGERARELLRTAGADAETAERVAALVAKRARPDDPDAQALEDAACLVFIEHQLGGFARRYDDAKMIDILQKTWRKMSPDAQQLARGLPLQGRAAELLQRALEG